MVRCGLSNTLQHWVLGVGRHFRDNGYVYPAFNCNNFAGSAALAEVCALLSDILVGRYILVLACLQWSLHVEKYDDDGGGDDDDDKRT